VDDRKLGDCVALTVEEGEGSICNKRKGKDKSVAYGLLLPLRTGKPVALVVEDANLQRHKRARVPMLLLTPMSVYGPPSKFLVVALQTYGCEVIDTSQPFRPIMFYRLGLRMAMATALSQQLNVVFNPKEK